MATRIVFYLLFIFFAAPIDSILVMWSGYITSNDEQFWRPLSEALIYIYAFVLSVETVFRIEQHHDILGLKPWLRLPQFVAGLVVIFFIIDYMGVIRPNLEASRSAIDSSRRQIVFATLAIIASVLSFAACESGKRATLTVRTSRSS